VAAAEALFRPGVLDVLDRVLGLFPEVVDEVGYDRLPALFGRHRVPRAGVRAADEAEQHAWRALDRAAVEGDADRSVEADGLPRETFFAPERLVVDDIHLRVGAHRSPLGELVAQDREQRFVVDPRRERGRHRDDRLLRRDLAFFELDLHALAVL